MRLSTTWGDFDERVMQQVLKTFYLDHDVDLSYDRTAVTRILTTGQVKQLGLQLLGQA